MSFARPSFTPPLAAQMSAKTPPAPFVPPLAAKFMTPAPSAPPGTQAVERLDRMNLTEAAEYMGVSRPTMRKLAGTIPHFHDGRIRRFDRAVLDSALRGDHGRGAE